MVMLSGFNTCEIVFSFYRADCLMTLKVPTQRCIFPPVFWVHIFEYFDHNVDKYESFMPSVSCLLRVMEKEILSAGNGIMGTMFSECT